MVIDTGANVNLIDQETWAKLPSGVNMEHTNTKIMSYNGPPLKICGQFKAEISSKGKSTTDTIYVRAEQGTYSVANLHRRLVS